MVEPKVKVFLSYSHEDESLRKKLAKHLKPLERQGLIEPWHDRLIDPGTDWQKELDLQLNSADIILPLVSASFVNSDFCYCIELERARERHDAGEAKIIPIFLRSVDLGALKGTPLRTLQGLPSPSNPVTKWEDKDEAFTVVAQGIRKVVEQVLKEKKKKQEVTPVGSRVSKEHYIEREEGKKLQKNFAAALQKPEAKPLLFNLSGIGGVGKTTLLARLQDTHRGEVDFLEVCFAKTPQVETPFKLMGKFHEQAMKLNPVGAAITADLFRQREQKFQKAVSQLSEGEKITGEEKRKITTWFQRLIWQSPGGFTTTSTQVKSHAVSGVFSALTAMGEDPKGLQEWIEQLVRNHPTTKDNLELQQFMLDPVSQLTEGFAETLREVAHTRKRPLVLVLDTYERAQSYLNRWLWQYLVYATPLCSAPVRLVVVGRRPLEADESWRKLHQDRQPIYSQQLDKFSRKETNNYLQEIGIKNGGTRNKIYKVTQGLPYYLNWVRTQRERGEELDFSQGNQAMAQLLLQGLDKQEQRILQVVACCRWFNKAMFRYLLEKGSFGDKVEQYFQWLEQSDFVLLSHGKYSLDDVARDVFRQSYYQEDRKQFHHTHDLLAQYFKQEADDLCSPESPLPDPYEDEEWRESIAEFLYYSLYQGREGLGEYLEQVFSAVYLKAPDVFLAPFAFINAEVSEENQHLLPKATNKALRDLKMVLWFGWFFLDKLPGSYEVKLEGENIPPEAGAALLKSFELSIQSLLGYVGDLKNGFSKTVALMYKSLRCKSSQEREDLLLEAKREAEQLSTSCSQQLLHRLFENLGYYLVLTTERYEEALECSQKAIDINPQSEAAWGNRGVALRDLERYSEALESFQKAIDINPQSELAWGNRGVALRDLERYSEALESSQKAIDINPQSEAAWVSRGFALGKLERHEEALESYQKAIALNPQSEIVWVSRGFALGKLERHEEALESYQKAIALNPQSELAWVSRGAALFYLERHEEALESYQKAIDINPQSEAAWVNRGDVLRMMRQYKEALMAYDRALEINPKNPQTLNFQALTWSLLKDFEKAMTKIDAAIKLKPQEVLYRANRGIILARAGSYPEALADCEQAIQQNPQHESGYYGKACYYALQGEDQQAIDNLQKAINIAPRLTQRQAKHNPDFERIRNHITVTSTTY